MIGGVVIRVVRPHGLEVHAPFLRAIGVAVLVGGLGLAVWARITLGRNWGMPMSEKEEPELVTGGPYRFTRHPIYVGIVVATAGTALATSLAWLIVSAVMTTYFGYSAHVEERILTERFPDAYPRYRETTTRLRTRRPRRR